MNGAHGMQELKYIKGGATLVFSLDGLQNNWLSDRGRQCIKKRDEELQFWISSGQVTQADEDLNPITCLCILGQRGTAAPQSRRNHHPKPSVPPQHCCLLERSQPIHHPTITSVASITNTFASESLKEAPWTRLIFNKRDFFGSITKDLNVATQRDTGYTMGQHKVFILLCDEHCSVPPEIFGDIYHKEHDRTINGINDTSKASGDLKNSTPCSPNTDSFEECKCEKIATDNINTRNPKSLLKTSRSYEVPGKSSGRDREGIKRKCVSFDEDVTVYLFDQESPTMELQSSAEDCTSPPCSYPYNLPDLTLDDSGFEWEDDFSALDWASRNCRQCVRHSPLSHRYAPTHSWTGLSRPRHFFLSQTCLFLTHVTESDLEL